MAKRPVLPDNYNPIGDRLKRAIAIPSVVPPIVTSADLVQEPASTEPIKEPTIPLPTITPLTIDVLQADPTGTELKESSVRFRCTDGERRKWHSLAYELTGESGRLSHLIRSALLLIENSYEELKSNRQEMQNLRHPGKVDPIGLVLYEQRLAEFMFDAIRTTGRPKW